MNCAVCMLVWIDIPPNKCGLFKKRIKRIKLDRLYKLHS